MLRLGSSTDDLCASCGQRGLVAWLSGEVAVHVRSREEQPLVRALVAGERSTTTAHLDLYLCARCLRRAHELA